MDFFNFFGLLAYPVPTVRPLGTFVNEENDHLVPLAQDGRPLKPGKAMKREVTLLSASRNRRKRSFYSSFGRL